MLPPASATRAAVTKYLESEQGRDAPEAVAVRLKRLPWHVLLPDRVPDIDEVHALRGMVEETMRRRNPGVLRKS